MAPNIKSLGLALVAVLAASAVAASAAHAAPEFTASPAGKATGSNTKGSGTLTSPGGTVTCDSHFLVEAVGGGNLAASTQATVIPNYSNCEAWGFLSADVTENGCDFIFTATERVATGHYNSHVAVKCPAGKAIVITNATCEVQIGESGNSNLTTATTENVANGVTVTLNAKEITLNVTKDGFGCPYSGTGHVKATYHSEVSFFGLGGTSFSLSG